MLQKQTGKNTVEVIEAVKARLAEITPQLPADVSVRVPIDTSEDIIFDIFTRFREIDRDRLARLPDVPILTPDGRKVRLQSVARIVEGRGPIEIERKNRQRILRVEAETAGRSLGDVSADVRRVVDAMQIPPGIRVHFGGDVEERTEALADCTGAWGARA